jgi:DnaK suppressor protein
MEKAMTMKQIAKFEHILAARAHELNSSRQRRDAIVIERTPERFERICGAAERELAVQRLEAASGQLRETQAALRRIEDGTFGICLACEQQIDVRRLTALPSAALCIRCQQESDCRCGAKSGHPVLAMAA